MTLLKTFGVRAREIKQAAHTFAATAHCAQVYARDTMHGASEADYDLLIAARDLEAAAADLRQLHAKIEQMRADLSNPVLVAAE